MTIVSGRPEGALAQVEDLQTIHTGDERLLLREAGQFLRRNGLDEGSVDLLLSGENGDSRLEPYYRQMESLFPPHAAIARFKHLCGEYCTASAFGFWLATEILRRKTIPEIAIKRPGRSSCECVLLYNNYRGLQHAFILLRAVSSGASA
jgi:hypothetical protein